MFVTLDSPYDRLRISGVEIRLRELERRINVSRIHPHKFRRTMATRAIDKGRDAYRAGAEGFGTLADRYNYAICSG